MTDPETNRPKVDPGEYAADADTLRNTFEIGMAALRQFGARTEYDLCSPVDDMTDQVVSYLGDRLGSVVLMRGLDMDRELAWLLDMDRAMERWGMSDAEVAESLLEDEETLATAQPERGQQYSLTVSDLELLRAAGYDDNVEEVTLDYVDCTDDPTAVYKHELYVVIKERLNFAGLHSRYTLNFTLANPAQAYGREDVYDFIRYYRPEQPDRVPPLGEEGAEVINFAVQSGELYIRVREAEQIVKLLELYGAHERGEL